MKSSHRDTKHYLPKTFRNATPEAALGLNSPDVVATHHSALLIREKCRHPQILRTSRENKGMGYGNKRVICKSLSKNFLNLIYNSILDSPGYANEAMGGLVPL